MTMRKRAHGALTAVLVAVSLIAAGCTIDTGDRSEEQAAVQEDRQQPPKVSVADGAEKVDPSEPVKVTAGDAPLKKVTMTNESGYEVEAKFNADKTEWTTNETLGYYRDYKVVAVDENGEKTTSSFSMLAPDATATAALAPLDGATVGIAQTVAARFSVPVQDRRAAQKAVQVTTEPKVEGAWYWLNDYEMRWRPEKFWQPGTKVTVSADIYGVNLGGGVYGETDNEASFTIGDDVRAEIDDATKTMKVFRGGELLRSIPVSLGRDGQYATPNGIYMIGEERPQMVMDSETFGLSHEAGGYRTLVDNATQMSYSGIYVHSAPWSVWAQGNTNTSHGCVNVTPEAAVWFQETVKRGDPVTVKNTNGGQLSGWDGLGDWNIPWSEWKAGNADTSGQ